MNQSKAKILLFVAALLLAGCASPTNTGCVGLRFTQRPNAKLIAELARTQPPQDQAAIGAWFARGELTFVLAATHTNEIADAIAFGGAARRLR